ncbi:MAG: serine--tRNA ligase [Chloroflexi bacterium]|nr:serine--tRNA ligase [Chloroflexota bacterium]
MLNIDLLVKDPEHVRERLRARGEPEGTVGRVLELDARRRSLIKEADDLRARRNEVSRAIGASGRKPDPDQLFEMRRVGDRIKQIDSELETAKSEFESVLLTLPNLPLGDVPVGDDPSKNVVVKQAGVPAERSYDVPAHWDLDPVFGVDIEAGTRMSGARFFALSGKAAQFQRALVSWMLDTHVRENGYVEVAPPLLVRGDAMLGSGNLPKFADNLYHDAEEDLWLVPTAEVALNAMHMGEIIPAGRLPLKYVAHTPCFRREKAAAGRDTRGIKRVHQFEKVEMFRFVEPQESEEALSEMVIEASNLCERLGLTYRLIQLCTGDIGFQSAKTFDIEVWAAGSKEWLEVSSISTCTDFQARRNNTRYRPQPNASPRYPHTLNGSGLALPRVIIALLENNFQQDGSIVVPPVLRPYAGFDRIP